MSEDLSKGEVWLIVLGAVLLSGSALLLACGPLLFTCVYCCPSWFNRLTAAGRGSGRVLTRELIEVRIPSEVCGAEMVASLPFEARACSICIEEYASGDRTRQLPCQHVFHVECVDTWFLENRLNPTCPLCTLAVKCLHLTGGGVPAASDADDAQTRNMEAGTGAPPSVTAEQAVVGMADLPTAVRLALVSTGAMMTEAQIVGSMGDMQPDAVAAVLVKGEGQLEAGGIEVAASFVEQAENCQRSDVIATLPGAGVATDISPTIPLRLVGSDVSSASAADTTSTASAGRIEAVASRENKGINSPHSPFRGGESSGRMKTTTLRVRETLL